MSGDYLTLAAVAGFCGMVLGIALATARPGKHPPPGRQRVFDFRRTTLPPTGGNDLIILTTEDAPSEDVMARIRTDFEEFLKGGQRVIVLTGGFSITITDAIKTLAR